MKIGLIGHNGFLGSAFLKIIPNTNEVVCYNRNNELEILKDCKIIINANGNSSKVSAEKDPIADFNANATFTLKLSLFAKEVDALLLHVSSGEANVFAKSIYMKSNPVNDLAQLSNYGLSKAVGEVLVKKYSSRYLIIRPSGLVGPGIKKGPIFDILNDKPLWIHPTSRLSIMRTSTTAQIALELAKKQFDQNSLHEEFNLTGENTITLFEASKILNKKLIFEENLPIYNSKIDFKANSRDLSLPFSENELMDFYHEFSKQ